MKFLLLFFIIPTISMATAWKDVSNPKSVGYSKKSDCEAQYAECFRLNISPFENFDDYDVIDEVVDGNPTFSKSEVESCIDDPDCQSKLEAKSCTDVEEMPIKNLDLLEVYCSKNTGFEQVQSGRKILQLNQVKQDARIATEAQEKILEDALIQAKQQMACGQDVIALLSVRNVPKNLSEAQMETLLTTYSLTKSLLESGALETAKAKIQAMSPDGVIVTVDDQTALVAKLDECLGL